MDMDIFCYCFFFFSINSSILIIQLFPLSSCLILDLSKEQHSLIRAPQGVAGVTDLQKTTKLIQKTKDTENQRYRKKDCKKNQQKTMKPSENVLKLQKSHKTKHSMSTSHRSGRPLRINFMSRYICFSQIGPFDVSFEELFSKVKNPRGFFRKIVF